MAAQAALRRYRELCEAIAARGGAAVAFSGGVDSSLLLHAAQAALGERVVAFQMTSPLHPAAEQLRAQEFAATCGCRLERLSLNPLEWPDFVANPPNRCYLCKKKIYSLFVSRLAANGVAILMDGTNADDLHDDRPGLLALQELGVVSPLADLGFSKQEVRACARALGLPVWNAPSASCLATRIRSGLAITQENIDVVAQMEAYLLGQGFLGCRVRWGGTELTIEVVAEDYPRLPTLLEGPSFHKMAHQKGFRAILTATRTSR